jgi:hypothetical protein
MYLCIRGDDGQELAGFEIGSYADFECFREVILRHIPDALEHFPLLMQHSECDGEWSTDELEALKDELAEISRRFRLLPAEHLHDAFEETAHCREHAHTLYDCFHNLDEENLFEALDNLCDQAIDMDRPIALK